MIVKGTRLIGTNSIAANSMPPAKTATVTRRGPKRSESQPPNGRSRLDAKTNGKVRKPASLSGSS